MGELWQPTESSSLHPPMIPAPLHLPNRGIIKLEDFNTFHTFC